MSLADTSSRGTTDPGHDIEGATGFVRLLRRGQANRFQLPLTADLCVGPPEARHLFGGVGLAAGIAALEQASGRPIVFASAHFVSFAPLEERLDLDVEILAESRHVTHASVAAHVHDKLVFRVSGALGARPGDVSRQWPATPTLEAPQAYPVVEHWRADPESLHGRLEVRLVKGRYGRERMGVPEPDGRLLLWVKPKPPLSVDTGFLAIVADLFPNAVGNALGLNAGGNSLDNTLRVLRVIPTAWVLAEIRVEGIESGFAHGAVRLFTETGELVAVASQSLVMRVRPPAL